MKRIRFSGVLLVVAVALMGGCLSSVSFFKSGPTETVGPRFQPAWYLRVPSGRNALYAVGEARSDNPSVAVERAERRARSHFSSLVSGVIETLGDTGTNGPPRSQLNRFEEVLVRHESTLLTLFSRKVVRADDSYRAYVLLRVPMTKLRERARSVSPSFESSLDWNDFVNRYYRHFDVPSR